MLRPLMEIRTGRPSTIKGRLCLSSHGTVKGLPHLCRCSCESKAHWKSSSLQRYPSLLHSWRELLLCPLQVHSEEASPGSDPQVTPGRFNLLTCGHRAELLVSSGP